MNTPIPPSSLLIPAGEHSIDCVVDAFFAASPPWLKARNA
jgi:hypothetical protein